MSLPDLTYSDWAICLVQSLAHVVWQGFLLLALAGCVDVVLRDRSAQTKYVLWFGTLCLMLLCLPLNLAILTAATGTGSPRSSSDTVLVVPTTVANEPAEATQSANWHMNDALKQSPTATSPVIAQREPTYQTSSSKQSQTPMDSAVGIESSKDAWQSVSSYAIALYGLGVLGMLMRLMRAVGGGRWLLARSVLVDDQALLSRFDHCARQMGLRARPVVAYCGHVATPIVVGIVKPAVLLPLALTTRLNLEQLETVLLHEFAHIRRWDMVTNLVQRLVEAALFFHPAVWLVSRRVTVEREHCCDDLVLGCGSEPCCYAESLVRLSELRREAAGLSQQNGVVLAATGGGGTRLRQRVLRILGQTGGGANMQLMSRSLVLLLGLLVTALTGLAALASRDLATIADSTRQIEQNTARQNEPSALQKTGDRQKTRQASTTAAGGEQGPTDLYGDVIPAGAAMRLGTMRFRSGGRQGAGLAFSHDGKMLISSSRQGMRVWDARTGRLLRQLDIGDLQVRGFRLSPDGKQVAALGFRFNEAEQQKYDIIQFSDVLTGKRQSSISWVGAKTDTKVLCYTPDGASIFTGSRDGTLRFWDVFTGEELLQRKLPKSDIQDMAVSPDGHQLVVITRRSVFQWEWLAGKEPQELNTGIDRPLSADFSPDGAWLVLGTDSEDVRLWDVKRRKLRRRMKKNEGWPAYARQVKFFPSGKLVAACDRRAVLVWDAQTGNQAKKFSLGINVRPIGLAVSPDGQWIAACGYGTIHVWNLETGKDLAFARTGHQVSVNRLVFTRVDGQQAAITASDDGTVRVWTPSPAGSCE